MTMIADQRETRILRRNSDKEIPLDLGFDEIKTTQAAAHLLKLRAAPMSYLKLIKLLYLADRKALIDWGSPITFDHYVSMNKGPVLSTTYELIGSGAEKDEYNYWTKHISSPVNYAVKLKKNPGLDELSDAEIKLLDDIFHKFGKMSRWDLVDITHKLPEWKDPEGSACPIYIGDILAAGNRSPEEIENIIQDLKSFCSAKVQS